MQLYLKTYFDIKPVKNLNKDFSFTSVSNFNQLTVKIKITSG